MAQTALRYEIKAKTAAVAVGSGQFRFAMRKFPEEEIISNRSKIVDITVPI